MSSAQFRPWSVKQTPDRGWFSVWDGETCIADVLKESEANAIANSRELLAACKSALGTWENQFGACALPSNIANKLRAAIAKADPCFSTPE